MGAFPFNELQVLEFTRLDGQRLLGRRHEMKIPKGDRPDDWSYQLDADAVFDDTYTPIADAIFVRQPARREQKPEITPIDFGLTGDANGATIWDYTRPDKSKPLWVMIVFSPGFCGKDFSFRPVRVLRRSEGRVAVLFGFDHASPRRVFLRWRSYPTSLPADALVEVLSRDVDSLERSEPVDAGVVQAATPNSGRAGAASVHPTQSGSHRGWGSLLLAIAIVFLLLAAYVAAVKVLPSGSDIRGSLAWIAGLVAIVLVLWGVMSGQLSIKEGLRGLNPFARLKGGSTKS